MNTLVIDVETSGLIPKENAITSITLKVFGKDIHNTIFIKPQKELFYDPRAMQITGISMAYLEQEGVDEITAIKKTITFINDNFERKPYVLGHNVEFDVNFINEMFKRRTNNLLFTDKIHCHRKDTMYNTLFLKDSGLSNIESLSLGSCYSHFCGLTPKDAHSSYGDVLMTEEIYKKQMKLIGGNRDA